MFSVVFYYLTVVVLNVSVFARVFQPQISSLFFNILGTGRFWVVVLFAPLVAILPDVCLKAYRQAFHPTTLEAIIRQRRLEALQREISVVPEMTPVDEKDELKPKSM